MNATYQRVADYYRLLDAIGRLRVDLQTSPEPDLQIVLDALSARLKVEQDRREMMRKYMRQRRRAGT